MEFAISSQLSNLIRWALALMAIYLVLPAIIFRTSSDSLLERIFSRYTRMVAVTIVLGYILLALKLYEVISLVAVFLMLIIFMTLPVHYRKHGFREMRTTISLTLYDFLDEIFHPIHLYQQYVIPKLNKIKAEFNELTTSPNYIQPILLFIVLGYATYLRFYDTLIHAAPAMSDAYVTLAWIKYIDGRVLFYDGIYPQGFHIYLSILHKFAACDALYILKYTGPFNGILTTIGIYLFVAKLTGRMLPGILSAFVYGVLGGMLPLEWQRQASTNSQEFALVFLLPAWSYAYSFLQTRERRYLWTAAASFAIIGLVHTLVLAFLWVGLACLVTAYLLVDFRQSLRPVRQLITAGIVTGLVAAFPVPIALLAGKKFHSSSLEFLTSTIQTGIPLLTLIDKLALLGFVVFLLMTLWTRKTNNSVAMPIFVFFIGAASFLMYLLVGPMTGSAVLVERLGILWSLMAAVGVGIGAEAVIRLIPGKQNTLNLSIVSLVAFALMAWSVSYIKPLPAQPYKMQYDMEINQYLRIAQEYTPSEWTIVSPEEGYDLALGKGWHIQLADFLSWYEPEKSTLVRDVNGNEEPLNIQDLFIFYQKRLFIVDMKIMEPILNQRIKNYAALEKWLAIYRETHNNLSVYYQDDFIEIYQIHQPKSKAELFQQIWGQGH